MQGKTIVLGVTGGIAAYKAAALCSKLTQAGADVRVIMTDSALKFISPLTFQALSRHDVYVDTFEEKEASRITHIDLADSADLVLVAPATANILGKMANGLADDMLTTTLLATTAPVMVAPAMNVHMYTHPAVESNIALLRARGVKFVEPGEGQLACGYVGKGRLAEPEEIAAAVSAFFAEGQLLVGKKVLVTAGGTIERIDAVRYLTNDSSGKMGYAIAEAAAEHGADVVLITAASAALPVPNGVKPIYVQSAEQMLEAVLAEFDHTDFVFKAAAVADYRPLETLDHKMKKKADQDRLTLELIKNPDILQSIGERKKNQIIVGFAAETHDLDKHAMDKLKIKNCDLLVANDVSMSGAGFGTDTNIVKIFDGNGLLESLPLQSKKAIAVRLLQVAAAKLASGKGEV
jgi:phosphopantothenoylcysteine decarboxylase / phosphopantothenate---cysteine ligase